MHSFKQHFNENISEMHAHKSESKYFRPSVRTGEHKFNKRQYEQDTHDMLRQADDLVKRMDGESKDRIKGEVAAMLLKIRNQYEASSDEPTDAKGWLARKRTEINRRSERMPAMPSYGEAVEYLEDLKRIIRG